MGNYHFYERLRTCRTRFQSLIMYNYHGSHQFPSKISWFSINIFWVKNAVSTENGKVSISCKTLRIGLGRDEVKNVKNENKYRVDHKIIRIKRIPS